MVLNCATRTQLAVCSRFPVSMTARVKESREMFGPDVFFFCRDLNNLNAQLNQLNNHNARNFILVCTTQHCLTLGTGREVYLLRTWNHLLDFQHHIKTCSPIWTIFNTIHCFAVFVCVPPDQSMDIKWICVRTAHSVLALVADNPADTGAEDATDDKRLSPCTSWAEWGFCFWVSG